MTEIVKQLQKLVVSRPWMEALAFHTPCYLWRHPCKTKTSYGLLLFGTLLLINIQGFLRVYSEQFGGSWIPLFSASKMKKSENYWVVGLNAEKLFCIICKSPDLYPKVTSKPILTLIDVSIPIACSDLGADALENEFMLRNMHLWKIQKTIDEMVAADVDTTSLDDEAFNTEAALDRCILRLIASCCNDFRGLLSFSSLFPSNSKPLLNSPSNTMAKKAKIVSSSHEKTGADFLPLEGGPGRKLSKGDALESKATVVYIGRIPHGFYEDEMEGFFKQFGTIKRMKIARNRKTGKSKHYGFIEFEYPEVAKIVAECMHNYLLFEHLLQVQLIPPERVHPKLWKGINRHQDPVDFVLIERKRQHKQKTLEEYKKQIERILKRDRKRKKKIDAAGIDYECPEIVGADQPALKKIKLDHKE